MYIGWDIGIKNLSYCLLDIIDDVSSLSNDIKQNIINIGEKHFQIIDWGQ